MSSTEDKSLLAGHPPAGMRVKTSFYINLREPILKVKSLWVDRFRGWKQSKFELGPVSVWWGHGDCPCSFWKRETRHVLAKSPYSLLELQCFCY